MRNRDPLAAFELVARLLRRAIDQHAARADQVLRLRAREAVQMRQQEFVKALIGFVDDEG